MSTREKKTITEFMIEEQRRFPEATGDFTAVLNHVRLACKRISYIVGRGALGAVQGDAEAINVQGERQMKLDVIANDIFLRTSEYGGHLAGMVSEELAGPYAIPAEYPARQVPAHVRSARRLEQPRRQCPGRQHLLGAQGAPRGRARRVEDFLQPGSQQLCAGYAIYGATTMLVLTLGRGVHGFTLDRDFGEFVLTHPNMTHSGRNPRVRHRRFERALLGAAGEALCGRVPAGPRGPARQGLQHALDRLAGRRGAPDPGPRRAVHVSAGYQGCRASPGGCGCSTRPIPWR